MARRRSPGRVGRVLACLAFSALAPSTSAFAQSPSQEGAAAEPAAPAASPAILIVDWERVLRETAASQGLEDQERRAQEDNRVEMEALRAELEAEEARLTALRDTAPREIFEEQVRAFDQRVREARRSSQAKAEALQARFAEARRRLAAAIQPVLKDMLDETGASMIVDARNIVMARTGADITDQVIARFGERAARTASPQPRPARPAAPGAEQPDESPQTSPGTDENGG